MATFICNKDFCEYCGDCLACYGDDPCIFTEDEKHVYIYQPRASKTTYGLMVPERKIIGKE